MQRGCFDLANPLGELFLLLLQPHGRERGGEPAYPLRIFTDGLPYLVHVVAEAALLGGLHAPRIDERGETGPDLLGRVAEDVEPDVTDPLDFFEAGADFRWGRIGRL